MYLSETSPPFLPHLHKALSHPSYGVRAASCQLTRALSRTISVLRTSLMDSGVGAEVIETLRREVELHTRRENGLGSTDAEEDDLGERAYTVEVAATATLCNLITDFSPLRTVNLGIVTGRRSLTADAAARRWDRAVMRSDKVAL